MMLFFDNVQNDGEMFENVQNDDFFAVVQNDAEFVLMTYKLMNVVQR